MSSFAAAAGGVSLPRRGLAGGGWAGELLAILSLDCPQGSRIVLRATGPQAREVAMTMASLFARKFGET